MDLVIDNNRSGLIRKPLQQLHENKIQSPFKTTIIAGKGNEATTKGQREKTISSTPITISLKSSTKRRRQDSDYFEEKSIENDDSSEININNSPIFVSNDSNSNISTSSSSSFPTKDHGLFISTPNINSRPPRFPTSNESNSSKNNQKQSMKEKESPQMSPQVNNATNNICKLPDLDKSTNASVSIPQTSPKEILNNNQNYNKSCNKNETSINSNTNNAEQSATQTQNYFFSMIASEMNELDEVLFAAAALSKKLKLRKECFDKQHDQLNSKNKENKNNANSSFDNNYGSMNKSTTNEKYQSLNKFVSLETGESVKCNEILPSHLIAATSENTVSINNNKNDTKLASLSIPTMTKKMSLTSMSTVQSKLCDWKIKYGETITDSASTHEKSQELPSFNKS